jgi:hypothetical protein
MLLVMRFKSKLATESFLVAGWVSALALRWMESRESKFVPEDYRVGNLGR